MKRMRWLAVLAVAGVACSCATMKGGKLPPLRVGMAPNYPPLIMLQGEKAAGAECDFAVQLASELGRPLVLASIPWDKLIDELGAGRIDIVMSGMTVTPARQARATFCDPYMNNPLVAIVRRGESGAYATAEAVRNAGGNVGAMQGTSAAAYVRRHFSEAKIMPVATRDDVAFNLANRRMDLYVDDLAAAIDVASRGESQVELVRLALEPQQLAWAVRPGNEELRMQANEALARWRANGLLDQILNQWMPYRPAFSAAAKAGGEK